MKSHDHADAKHGSPTVTVLGMASSNGYQFLNFDGPTPGTNAATGTNANGIANSGTAVGFDDR